MDKDYFAVLRLVSLVCLLLVGKGVYADDDDIYVAKEKDQYSEDENVFNWDLDRFALQLNLASHHPGSSEDYNEWNRGLGIEYHLDEFFITGGYFWNSLYRDSFYLGVGKELTFGNVNWIGIGAIAGALTGYEDGQEPLPAVVPYLFLTKDRYTIKIAYIPEFGDVEDDAFGFALRILLD